MTDNYTKIDQVLFKRLDFELDTSFDIAKRRTTYWQDAWRRLKLNKFAVVGLVFIIVISLAAVIGPWLSHFSYSDQELQRVNEFPSWEHPFGTDNLGRDLMTRVLYGARISMSIGIVVSFLNLIIGVLYGGAAGYFGGKLDDFLMRLIDILWSIPSTLIVILLMVVLGPGLINIYIALVLFGWIGIARQVRGQILALRELEYVMAAKLIGAGHFRIIMRHLIPNALGIIIVYMTFGIPGAIFTEAFLSYIGLGVSAPIASWGTLASDGVSSLQSYPFQIFFPALAISLTMLSFNFFGDGLRDALDPRMRK